MTQSLCPTSEKLIQRAVTQHSHQECREGSWMLAPSSLWLPQVCWLHSIFHSWFSGVCVWVNQTVSLESHVMNHISYQLTRFCFSSDHLIIQTGRDLSTSPNSCSKQHHLWGQAWLLSPLIPWILKAFEDGACTTFRGNTFNVPLSSWWKFCLLLSYNFSLQFFSLALVLQPYTTVLLLFPSFMTYLPFHLPPFFFFPSPLLLYYLIKICLALASSSSTYLKLISLETSSSQHLSPIYSWLLPSCTWLSSNPSQHRNTFNTNSEHILAWNQK